MNLAHPQYIELTIHRSVTIYLGCVFVSHSITFSWRQDTGSEADGFASTDHVAEGFGRIVKISFAFLPLGQGKKQTENTTGLPGCQDDAAVS
ncbi:hypothetical protein DPEC_G00177520 [Dallia pectoralis]|uniref:Uncharacterized protein n=1 Tax=Dallia pectoralis TaxID=75939 RepID=A0ACC2GEW8_DALPE|nr:hypothetical protein DPEC_G00177520 [Dallia pectoralis]